MFSWDKVKPLPTVVTRDPVTHKLTVEVTTDSPSEPKRPSNQSGTGTPASPSRSPGGRDPR